MPQRKVLFPRRLENPRHVGNRDSSCSFQSWGIEGDEGRFGAQKKRRDESRRYV